MHDIDHQQPETLSLGEANDPDMRILRRVSRLDKFPFRARGDGPVRRIAIVDTETTGTDPLTDEVIDIAVVMLEVDDAGEIVGIASAGQALRDPHFNERGLFSHQVGTDSGKSLPALPVPVAPQFRSASGVRKAPKLG